MDPNNDQAPLAPPDVDQSEPNQNFAQPVANQQQPQSQTTDILGIVSIVMAVVGLSLIGLIVAIIGMKKAKEEGYSNTVSKVGLIINIVLLSIVVVMILLLVLLAVGMSSA